MFPDHLHLYQHLGKLRKSLIMTAPKRLSLLVPCSGRANIFNVRLSFVAEAELNASKSGKQSLRIAQFTSKRARQLLGLFEIEYSY